MMESSEMMEIKINYMMKGTLHDGKFRDDGKYDDNDGKRDNDTAWQKER